MVGNIDRNSISLTAQDSTKVTWIKGYFTSAQWLVCNLPQARDG